MRLIDADTLLRDIEKYHLKENQVIEFELDHNTKGVFIKCLKTT